MKISFSIFVAIISLVSVARPYNLTADTASSSLQNADQRNVIVVEAGYFGTLFNTEQGWGTPFAFRAGYGAPVSRISMLYWNLEYYEYHLASGVHNTSLGPSSALRHDVAAYVNLCVVHAAVIGAGAYYTKTDPVHSSWMLYSTPWEDGKASIKFFFIMGAMHEIKVSESIFLPVGLYFRSSYHDRAASFIFRTGLGFKL